MLELKELKNKYIEYSEEITEDIFNKILNRAKEFAREVCQNQRTYGSFDDDSFDSFRLNKFFRFSGEDYSYSYGVDNNRQSAKEIKVSDILGEETKFEVGKWYSFYWNWNSGYDIVAKVSELGEVIRFDNFINIKQGSHLDQSSNSIRLTEIENIKELTLEEIQQYLPDGHPDKIVKEFVLPEKWYIKTTEENQKVVGAWLMKNDYQPNINDLDKGGYTNWYFKYPRGGDCSGSRKKPSEDYIEITLEQFKQYVLKEPKPLSVDDLVEGEIYYFKTSYEYIVKFDKLINGDICGTKKIIIRSDCFGGNYNNPISLHNEIRLVTPEEKHWLLTSIKQNKFVPKKDLSKYDSEGNLIKMKEYVNTATEEQFLFIIAKLSYKSTGWTWRGKETCINLQLESYSHPEAFEANNYYTFQEWLDLNGYIFTGKIANKFNIGDEVQVCSSKEDVKGCGYLRISDNRLEKVGGVSSEKGKIESFKDYKGVTYYKLNSLCQGFISEDCLKLVKSCVAPKESKEMQLPDLKNPIFNVGDTARVIADSLREFNNSWTDGNNTGYKKGYVGIITDIGNTSNHEVNAWCYLEDSVSGISCNLLELVEPAKFSESKVNRNVYYEVETQDQYNEILDWLESKGEQVNKYYDVIGHWKYICFENSEWCLDRRVESQLSKAEFQFKDKPATQPIKTGEGIKAQILKYPIIPIPEDFKWKITVSKKVSKPIPEIPKVKNRFKTSPIKKRSLPEIY